MLDTPPLSGFAANGCGDSNVPNPGGDAELLTPGVSNVSNPAGDATGSVGNLVPHAWSALPAAAAGFERVASARRSRMRGSMGNMDDTRTALARLSPEPAASKAGLRPARFCRRDVEIRTSDNSGCPWWHICGLTFASGCSTCPPGFQDDGCFCRIDAWIFAKNTQVRGVGTLPTECGPGREYDAGLCYENCAPTFNGVGPVCWGACPAGFDDHGATCWRPPNSIIKTSV